jgi:hypothetical protein
LTRSSGREEEEAVDHGVDLLGHFELAEMPRPDDVTVMQLRHQLSEPRDVGARRVLVGGDMAI